MSLIKITRGKKKKLIENLIDNRDYMDNAGIVISEANILKRCELIALRMNYIENMFDTLCGGFEYGEEAMEHINRVIQNRLDRLKLSPQEIAEIAHGKAVPSIQDVIENEWRKEENERIDIYHKSNFIQACSCLARYRVSGNASNAAAEKRLNIGECSVGEAAVLYFFAIHKHINPAFSDDDFLQKNEKEIIDLFEKFVACYVANNKNFSSTLDLIKFFLQGKKRKGEQQAGRIEDLALTYSSSITNAIAETIAQKGKYDPITKTRTIETAGGKVSVYLNGLDFAKVGTDKLFRYGLSLFTKANTQGTKKEQLITDVRGDTKAFARANGIKIDPQKMNTPEEQEKEDARAKKRLERFVASLKEYAIELTNTKITADYTIKGVKGSLVGNPFIPLVDINSKTITFSFLPISAVYLASLPIGYTSASLYKIDNCKRNAYLLATYILTRYSMDNNVIRDTERKVSIREALAHTSLPTLEECTRKRLSWKSHIMDKLMDILDSLCECEFIAKEEFDDQGHNVRGGYKLILPNNKQLSAEQEAAGYPYNYDQFENMLIWCELSNFPDHETRLQEVTARKEKSKAAAAKKRKTTSKKKKDPACKPEGQKGS